jgi:hypothetical protein
MLAAGCIFELAIHNYPDWEAIASEEKLGGKRPILLRLLASASDDVPERGPIVFALSICLLLVYNRPT